MAGMSSRRTSISSCVVGKLTCGPPARQRGASAAAAFSSGLRARCAAPRAPSSSCAAAPTGGFSAPRRGARVSAAKSAPRRAALQMAGAARCLRAPQPAHQAEIFFSHHLDVRDAALEASPQVRLNLLLAVALRGGQGGRQRGARARVRAVCCAAGRAAPRARALAASRKYGANLTCDLKVLPSCAARRGDAGRWARQPRPSADWRQACSGACATRLAHEEAVDARQRLPRLAVHHRALRRRAVAWRWSATPPCARFCA